MNSLPHSARSVQGLPYANPIRMFADRVARHPDAAALRHKQGGAWRTLTWRELDVRGQQLAVGLHDWAQLSRNERVAVVANNSLGWVLVDLALARSGAVSVPIEPHARGDELADALERCQCALIVVGSLVEFRRVHALLERGRMGTVRGIVLLDLIDDAVSSWPASSVPVTGLAQLQRRGEEAATAAFMQLEARTEALRPEDLFTIIHTPKTSAQASKGVALSQGNIVYETWALRNVIAVDSSDEQLLVLPLCHAFGRHLLWAAFASGAVTAVMDPRTPLLDNLVEIGPTFFGAAPVVYEAIRRRVLRDVEDSGRVRAKTFAWCLQIGQEVSGFRQRGELVPGVLAVKQAAADRLVLTEIRRQFGGRLRFLVSGAAPARREVLEFFHAVGLLILEGYGLTETSGAVSVNRPDRYRLGSVGPALPGCEVRIAEDGEVLVRGKNVMLGYVGASGEIEPTVDARGWLHTGDLGAVEHGFLRIVGRKAEAITLATGRTVHPEPIEQALGEHADVAYALVCGAGRPYLTALVVLDRAALESLAKRHGLADLPAAQLCTHPRVRERVGDWVHHVNRSLPAPDRIAAFAILPRDLGTAVGELTPTQRPRRHVVYRNWKDTIDALYARQRVPNPAGDGNATGHR
ncbi:MAG: AMP-binding protein [Myxococcales bacterium FL481]|nr:MAG: AMP-binding protein [Myxococcales bacterium FL481]